MRSRGGGLRQRQSGLGRPRTGAGRGTRGHRRHRHRDRRPRRGRRRGSHRAAGAGRVRRLRRGSRRRCRDAGGDRNRNRPRHAVPGHLRRHATHGRTRPGAHDHPRIRLDQGRNGRDARTGPAPAADGLERAGFHARLASAAGRNATGRPRLFRPQLRTDQRRVRTKSSPPPIMAAPCRPSWRRATAPARSSMSRKARRSASACWPISCAGRPEHVRHQTVSPEPRTAGRSRRPRSPTRT